MSLKLLQFSRHLGYTKIGSDLFIHFCLIPRQAESCSSLGNKETVKELQGTFSSNLSANSYLYLLTCCKKFLDVLGLLCGDERHTF